MILGSNTMITRGRLGEIYRGHHALSDWVRNWPTAQIMDVQLCAIMNYCSVAAALYPTTPVPQLRIAVLVRSSFEMAIATHTQHLNALSDIQGYLAQLLHSKLPLVAEQIRCTKQSLDELASLPSPTGEDKESAWYSAKALLTASVEYRTLKLLISAHEMVDGIVDEAASKTLGYDADSS